MPIKNVEIPSITVLDALAASAAAHRINNGYTRNPYYTGVVSDNDSISVKKSNRELMLDYLSDKTHILDEDYELAKKIKFYFDKKIFKILDDSIMDNYTQSVMKILSKKGIIMADVSILASVPESYFKGLERDRISDIIENACNEMLAPLKDRVTVSIEIVKCIFSKKWFTHFVTGITTDNKVVFFASKNPIDVGIHMTITGTVKKFQNNQTTLNRVVIK